MSRCAYWLGLVMLLPMPVDAQGRQPNRLIREKSPYLLQHAYNPVDWYPWGPEAFAKAGQEGKPVMLSVGYSTCYWCHVMEQESFDNPEIAALLNETVVPVKVDREERPDLDALYMAAVQAMTGSGGWLGPSQEIVIAGDPKAPDTRAMLRAVHARFLPRAVLALQPADAGSEAIEALIPFIKSQRPLEGKATAYVCENYICNLPTTDLTQLLRLLDAPGP